MSLSVNCKQQSLVFSTWVTIAWLIPQMVSLQLIAADLNSFSDNADIIGRGELIKIF